jgi:sulfur relay protein TusB/DsrH
MLVIVKNSIDTPEGKREVRLARDMAADLVLIQNGVYFVRNAEPNDFGGKVYVLYEDLLLRGFSDGEIGKDMEKIDYTILVDLLVGSDKVVGML